MLSDMKRSSLSDLERRLVAMVRSSDELMVALRAVRSLGLASWCIGAGAVRTLVWDALHGFAQPSTLEDVDVVYFDEAAVGSELRSLGRRSTQDQGPHPVSVCRSFRHRIV
jgi:hypothetical protein